MFLIDKCACEIATESVHKHNASLNMPELREIISRHYSPLEKAARKALEALERSHNPDESIKLLRDALNIETS